MFSVKEIKKRTEGGAKIQRLISVNPIKLEHALN